jgi:hypothetical protein
MATDERELDFREREIVLRADFGELDDGNCLPVSVRFIMQGPRAPRTGEWVYLLDQKGCGCMARVESMDGWLARVKPDWASWIGSDRPPVEAGGTAPAAPS